MMNSPRCAYCHRYPNQINIYKYGAEEEGITADEYVMKHEGTLNTETGTFACDLCYVQMGQPSHAHPGKNWTP